MNIFNTIVEDFYGIADAEVSSQRQNGKSDPTFNNHKYATSKSITNRSSRSSLSTSTATNSTIPKKGKKWTLHRLDNALFSHDETSKPGKSEVHFSSKYWNKKIKAINQNPKEIDPEKAVEAENQRQLRIKNEHKAYSHLSIFTNLDTIQREIGTTVRDYFAWTYMLIYYTAFIAFLSMIWEIWNVLSISNIFGVSVEGILSSPNFLLWISIVYQQRNVSILWYIIVFLVVIFSILAKELLVMFMQREERELLVHQEHQQRNVEKVNESKSLPVNHDEIHKQARTLWSTKNNNEHFNLDPPKNHPSLVLDDEEGVNEHMEDIQLEHDTLQRDEFRRKQIWGRTISASVFVFLLILQFFFSWYFFVIHDYSYQLTTGAILVSTLIIINLFWTLISQRLTQLECHTNWMDYFVSLTIKNYIFKWTSTIITFNISQLQVFLAYSVPSTDSESFASSSLPNTDCRFVILTEQYFFLVLSDLAQTIVFSLIWPEIYNRYILPWRQKRSHEADNDLKLEFLISQQWFALLYTEMILMWSVLVSPFLGALTMISLVIGLYINKRLLFQNSKPVILIHARFIRLYYWLSLVNVVIWNIPPNGIPFIIWGYEHSCQLLL